MKRKSFATIFCIAATIYSSSSIPKAGAQEWIERAPMPIPCAAMAAAAVGTNIYVFGGVSDDFSHTTATQCYSTLANSWKICREMPTVRVEMAALAVGDKIYVIGGYNLENYDLDVVEIYDPATDTWTLGTPMPTPRSQIFGTVIEDKIYITGGWPGSYTALEIYDPATDTWTTGAPMPEGIMQNNSGTTYDGRFYTIGGKSYGYDGDIYNTNYAYDPIADEWESRADLPKPLFGGAAATFEGKLHYFGGSQDPVARDNNFASHYIYDSATNSWDTGIALPKKLANLVSVTVGDGIYVMGGYEDCATCDPLTGINIKYTNALPSSVPDLATENFSVYPNPVINDLYISIPGNHESKQISIMDIAGREVLSLCSNNENIAVNTSDFPGGVYVLNLLVGKKKKSQSFVKE